MHFCPLSQYRRQYDPPQTPYYRVLACPSIDNLTKIALNQQHLSLNPFKLKANIEEKLKIIFKHLKVTSNLRQRI